MKALAYIAMLAVAALVAHGIYKAVSEDVGTAAIVNDCREHGGVPHVDRDDSGKVLAVRCDHAAE